MQYVLFNIGIILIVVGALLLIAGDLSKIREDWKNRNAWENPVGELTKLLAALERLMARILPVEQKTHGVFLILVGAGLVVGSFWAP
jgi:hypothetical protein